MPPRSACSQRRRRALGLVLGVFGAALVGGPRSPAAAPADAGLVDAAAGTSAVGTPADPEALVVRIVLEDTPRGREALARVQRYFAAMPRRLGIVARLEAGLDSDPQQRAVLAGWRQMIEAERARSPALPLVIAADERNAGFFGPLVRVGLSQVLAGLEDAVLLEADKLQRAHGGGPPATGAAGGAGSTGSESRDPPAGAVGVARAPVVPRDNPALGLSYGLALVVSGLLAALVWWCGEPRGARVVNTPGAPVETSGAPRRRRRRR